jgi:lysozyme
MKTRSEIEQILKESGVDLKKEKLALVAIRTVDAKGGAKVGVFDDQMIWIDEDTFAPYEANVDPSSYKLNVATLKPTHPGGKPYRYRAGDHCSKVYGCYPGYRQAAPVRVLRWQKAGVFKEEGLTTSINIHHGSKNNVGTSSLGCLTVRYSNWKAFKAEGDMLIAKHKVKDFPLIVTLSNATTHSVFQVLVKGMKGADVAALQTDLTKVGYPLKADGNFGPQTEAAVKSFQKAHGLVVDGKVGKLTLAALSANVAVPPKPSAAPSSIGKAGLDLIKHFEGYYAKAYLCPAKVWTIGWGTTYLPDGTRIKKGDVCTKEQAEKWLAFEVNEKSKSISKLIKVPVNQNEFSALVSFAYNVGTGAFGKSTLLKKLNAGDRVGAAEEFSKWVKAAGKTLAGLVRRRRAEKELFLA